jgi:hypothetical protein
MVKLSIDETKFKEEIEELFLEYEDLVSKKTFSSKSAFKMVFRKFIGSMKIVISGKK